MNSSDNFQDSALSRLMPLMNSSFTPGQAQATVDNFQDLDQRQIAQAELYYFSGRAEECRNIAELYLQDKDLCLRLSAALLYSFSNLTLGNPVSYTHLDVYKRQQWKCDPFRTVRTVSTLLHECPPCLPVLHLSAENCILLSGLLRRMRRFRICWRSTVYHHSASELHEADLLQSSSL